MEHLSDVMEHVTLDSDLVSVKVGQRWTHVNNVDGQSWQQVDRNTKAQYIPIVVILGWTCML